ncbi:DUF3304 domain-containing protein [Stenotrophomonas sp. 24(2023)]|uniref:DUF3304 domain-containing protein n=1 Tax=Stenotrophomonas sp. 24(2023) TaxID=3068324 RepID=UPI0027E029ED|nr:DUF3304 domain-containing protein [Stenotrophomonas sp. 24(2023)]WMJ70219.1 DUF3304 domain-containing protein [Stenotrophomonas sp. 24(2023)]
MKLASVLIACVLGLAVLGIGSKIAIHHAEQQRAPVVPPKPPLIDTLTGRDLSHMPPNMGVRLAIANYSDDGLGTVFINGTWGGGMEPNASGNPATCCVSLPRQWQPGLKVSVAYRTSSMYLQDKQSIAERDVMVPPYSPFVDGFIYFMYFPGDDLRVVVTRIGLGYPGFPFDIAPPELEDETGSRKAFLAETRWTDLQHPANDPSSTDEEGR